MLLSEFSVLLLKLLWVLVSGSSSVLLLKLMWASVILVTASFEMAPGALATASLEMASAMLAIASLETVGSHCVSVPNAQPSNHRSELLSVPLSELMRVLVSELLSVFLSQLMWVRLCCCRNVTGGNRDAGVRRRC